MIENIIFKQRGKTKFVDGFKLIDLKLGDIKGYTFNNYNIYIDPKNDLILYEKKITKIRVILFILLFGLIGPFLTLFFHKNCFYFFYKRVGSDFFNPRTYRSLNNSLLNRGILFIISLIISINTLLLILYKLIENVNRDYDWGGLYRNLKKNGYTPEKFKDGYIQVEIFKNEYRCAEGNHRKLLLEYIYGKNKKITVKFIGVTYEK